jgi:hypothetical protein
MRRRTVRGGRDGVLRTVQVRVGRVCRELFVRGARVSSAHGGTQQIAHVWIRQDARNNHQVSVQLRHPVKDRHEGAPNVLSGWLAGTPEVNEHTGGGARCLTCRCPLPGSFLLSRNPQALARGSWSVRWWTLEPSGRCNAWGERTHGPLARGTWPHTLLCPEHGRAARAGTVAQTPVPIERHCSQ